MADFTRPNSWNDTTKLSDPAGTPISPATYDAQTDGSQKTQIVDSSAAVLTVYE